MTVKMTVTYNIAVIGAASQVGRGIFKALLEQDFPYGAVHALAADNSVKQSVSFGDERVLTLESAASFDYTTVDFVFSAASAAEIKSLAPRIKASGAILIDTSSAFSLEPGVPLVVPEVNSHRVITNGLSKISKGKGQVVASPNCIATPLALTLKALSAVAPLEMIVVSTYEAVSGAGSAGMDVLHAQARQVLMVQPLTNGPFDRPIAFNIIPFIDTVQSNGSTRHEEDVRTQTIKILESPVKMAVTCAQVPVFVGDCFSVHVSFKKTPTLQACQKAMKDFPGLTVHTRANDIISPIEIVGESMVHVCRMRTSQEGLNYWVSCDNLRKGSAQNAVQIAGLLASHW